MTAFHYEGLTNGGTRVEGIVEARDKDSALIKAKENCRVVIRIKPLRAGSIRGLHTDLSELFGKKKIEERKLVLLCSQMALELKAGMPIVQSLQLAAANETDRTLRTILEAAAEDVQAGSTLADSLERDRSCFPRIFTETIRTGEESGHLDETFARLQTYYSNRASVNSKVGSALIYPAMLIIVAIAVVCVIMVTAIPVFEEAFAGKKLPLPTRILIGLSSFMASYWPLCLFIAVLLILLFHSFARTERGSVTYSRWALSIPMIGRIQTMSACRSVCSTLHTLLASGIPLSQSLQITANSADNPTIRRDLEKSFQSVLEGQRIGAALAQSRLLPTLLIEMISVGEETGRLEDTLTILNDYYTREIETTVQRTLSILEPVIVITMALLVIFILLSVYLPLFSMYGAF